MEGSLAKKETVELLELVPGRELEVVEKVDGLFEGGVPREVADVVAHVPEPAGIAVDVRDLRLGGHDVAKALLGHAVLLFVGWRSPGAGVVFGRRSGGVCSGSSAARIIGTSEADQNAGGSEDGRVRPFEVATTLGRDGSPRDPDPRRRHRARGDRGRPPRHRRHRGRDRLGVPGDGGGRVLARRGSLARGDAGRDPREPRRAERTDRDAGGERASQRQSHASSAT